VEHVERMGVIRNAYKIFIGKAEGKRPRGREGNIVMDLREICWESVDWMHLTQDRDQWRTLVNNNGMNVRVPCIFIAH